MLAEYQLVRRSNYLIGLASIGFGLLISVMFDTCFHLIIFKAAGIANRGSIRPWHASIVQPKQCVKVSDVQSYANRHRRIHSRTS